METNKCKAEFALGENGTQYSQNDKASRLVCSKGLKYPNSMVEAAIMVGARPVRLGEFMRAARRLSSLFDHRAISKLHKAFSSCPAPGVFSRTQGRETLDSRIDRSQSTSSCCRYLSGGDSCAVCIWSPSVGLALACTVREMSQSRDCCASSARKPYSDHSNVIRLWLEQRQQQIMVLPAVCSQGVEPYACLHERQ